jgi:hypothetical protein
MVDAKTLLPERLNVKSEIEVSIVNVLGSEVHESTTVKLAEPIDDTHTRHFGAVVASVG